MGRNRAVPALGIALLATTVLLIAGCRDDADDATPTRTTTTVTAPGSTLVPAESDSPAAGACTEADPEWAVATLHEDVPDPRCEYITATERLRVVNATNETVTITFAGESVALRPGVVKSFDRRFGDYLAPGVHVVHASLYAGSGTELWLRPPE